MLTKSRQLFSFLQLSAHTLIDLSPLQLTILHGVPVIRCFISLGAMHKYHVSFSTIHFTLITENEFLSLKVHLQTELKIHGDMPRITLKAKKTAEDCNFKDICWSTCGSNGLGTYMKVVHS